MAKKATRKKAVKSKSRSAKAAKPAKKRAGIRRRGSSDPRASDPRTTRRTARKKTAARGAATRKRRSEPVPAPASKTATVIATARGVVAGAVKAVAKRLPGRSSAKPDGIELLEREHRQFEELLKQGEESTERAKKSRRAILKTLTASLNAHELMEESVLYPALHSHSEARDVVLEGFEEHHVADVIVKELQDVAEDDEQWGAKFKVLKENIEHHIKEEEHVMFPMARGLFSQEELRELAVRMLALKPSPRKRRT